MAFASELRMPVVVCAGVAASLAATNVAMATISASDPFVTIVATSGSHVGTFTVPLIDADTASDPDVDLWGWTAGNTVSIVDDTNSSVVVATLVSFGVIVGRQTQLDGEVRFGVDFDFSVVAGSAATKIEIFSPTLFFGPLADARGLSSAGYNGTDQDLNSISITPGLASGFAYESMYNGSSVFQQYLNTTLSGSGSVVDQGNPIPPGVFQPIAGPVSSMRARMSFTVSAFDSVAGSSQFSIAPAPGAAALLGLGGLVTVRRRR